MRDQTLNELATAKREAKRNVERLAEALTTATANLAAEPLSQAARLEVQRYSLQLVDWADTYATAEARHRIASQLAPR